MFRYDVVLSSGPHHADAYHHCLQRIRASGNNALKVYHNLGGDVGCVNSQLRSGDMGALSCYADLKIVAAGVLRACCQGNFSAVQPARHMGAKDS